MIEVTTKFYAGDVVYCVNNIGRVGHLIVGNAYTVRESYRDYDAEYVSVQGSKYVIVVDSFCFASRLEYNRLMRLSDTALAV